MRTAIRVWQEEDAILSYEWVLLVSLLTIGAVSGLAAARDAIIDELGDVSQALVTLDQSYSAVFPLGTSIHGTGVTGASDSGFTDGLSYQDCPRNAPPVPEGPIEPESEIGEP